MNVHAKKYACGFTFLCVPPPPAVLNVLSISTQMLSAETGSGCDKEPDLRILLVCERKVPIALRDALDFVRIEQRALQKHVVVQTL